jgi:hypothetical protein
VFERWSSPRVVERGAVAARDHQVVLETVLKAHLAADQVLDHRLAVVRGVQTHRGPRLVAMLAAIADARILGLPGPDLIRRRGIAVGPTGGEQLADPLRVALAALELTHRALVPVELEPAQRIEDLLDVLAGRALAVGVLDPQDELAAPAARHEPVIECGAGPTDVQGTGG